MLFLHSRYSKLQSHFHTGLLHTCTMHIALCCIKPDFLLFQQLLNMMITVI